MVLSLAQVTLPMPRPLRLHPLLLPLAPLQALVLDLMKRLKFNFFCAIWMLYRRTRRDMTALLHSHYIVYPLMSVECSKTSTALHSAHLRTITSIVHIMNESYYFFPFQSVFCPRDSSTILWSLSYPTVVQVCAYCCVVLGSVNIHSHTKASEPIDST